MIRIEATGDENSTHRLLLISGMVIACLLLMPVGQSSLLASPSERFRETIRAFSAFGDRSSGTKGAKAAAEFIRERFESLGLEEVDSHHFLLPVLRHRKSMLTISGSGMSVLVSPLRGNAISPGTIPAAGLAGPLIYVGSGELSELNGKTVADAVILMEFDSAKNWLHAASLGAKALIYIDRGSQSKTFFNEKLELTPIRFPRFWMPLDQARKVFGSFESAPEGRVSKGVCLVSETVWEEVTGENVYGTIYGVDPQLGDELIIIEAFYDSTAYVAGMSPGADEACGIATLLNLAQALKQNPPARSVLLIATDGHAHALNGMREMIWSLRERSKEFRDTKKKLRDASKSAQKSLKLLNRMLSEEQWLQQASDPETGIQIKEALTEQIKTEVDVISRRLMHLRLQESSKETAEAIRVLAEKRLILRRLVWRNTFSSLTPEEQKAVRPFVPLAIEDQKRMLTDAKRQQKYLGTAADFRSLVRSKEVVAVISLHLSSHGDGVGAFNQGWLYPLKPTIDRVTPYSTLDDVLMAAAARIEKALNLPGMFKDTLRPSRRRPWQSYFLDRPQLGGEVSSLAGYIGITLATVHDARPLWGTPFDGVESVDTDYAAQQSLFVCELIKDLVRAPTLHSGVLPRNGFSTVAGRANFMRHGELFAEQPAPGSILLSYQHMTRYYSMVDTLGIFRIKGVADKKHVLHKVIIEGYRFDPETGESVWAIDKKETGKSAYRVKMQRRSMETDLVMFACKQTTLFNLLEPRTLRYLTKIKLIDGRREATPMRYWWSRIDTQSSIITSIFMETGSRVKMTLSDTVLRNKLILTHATKDHPEGVGYLIDEWPLLYRTEYRVARDMWALLDPRIANLESRGIFNERIRKLQQEGTAALADAEGALEERRYDLFFESVKHSWALATRVYDHVEKTQKDVLFGVLFYIALFVPFAFCMERLLFSYANIYKRIIAFAGILILLIAVIYKVHPAFKLAYSPMVVILAFFIMGLSMMVTLIIFFRFEAEMVLLQRRARNVQADEISRWKAFLASFFLGVSNLRRRRLRTGLTCATLIILTFTIMSFTSVKTMRRHARILYQPTAPYQGFLLKNAGWQTLPPEALGVFSNTFANQGVAAPRVWMEAEDKTQSTRVPVRHGDRMVEAQGLVGLSAKEPQVTGLDQILVAGRWFEKNERYAVLLPKALADNLGISGDQPLESAVRLWGIPFEVVGIFSGQRLQELPDLDGEPLTPVTYPSEISVEMTEVEVEAMESGEDVEIFQSRYQHVSSDLTVIVPHQTLLAAGGQLKGISVRPIPGTSVKDAAQELVDRFGLALFSGENEGTYLYNASDTMSYSGVPNIAIPLLISIFIVLNTMIGSVYERKREIGIYTSVGLAPSHVSFLFIAEALALAVLSVVLGYLLAQVTASLFSGTALWAGITVNYSSLAGVAAMLLVILVVLISVIYPSKVAADIAIPDVNRSWKLPKPHGNTLEITLPFLMKYKEQASIAGFIYDYFQGHQDVSHGIFSTGEITFGSVCPYTPVGNRTDSVCVEGSSCTAGCLQMHTQAWLAPFDFGIMQQVEVQFCPAAEEEGFIEINVRMVRKSGEANAWLRINKGFLHVFRKQLLTWRSLDAPAHDHYERLFVATHRIPNPQPESTPLT